MNPQNGNHEIIDLYRTGSRSRVAEDASRTPPGSIWVPNGPKPAKPATRSSPIVPRSRCARFRARRDQSRLLLERRGEPQSALACWGEALQTDAHRIVLLNQRARLLEQLGQFADAEAAMRASLTIDRDQPDVIQHWLHVRQRMCLWPILSDAIHGLSADDLMESCGRSPRWR